MYGVMKGLLKGEIFLLAKNLAPKIWVMNIHTPLIEKTKMESKISVILAAGVGILLSAPFVSVIAVLITAFMTGAAGWAGQKFIQWAWNRWGVHLLQLALHKLKTFKKRYHVKDNSKS